MDKNVICDENVCLKCSKESPFDHIPEHLKGKTITLTENIIKNVTELTADKFSCGVTKQESTEIDSENLKIVCENKLCFLCKRTEDEKAAILDVEMVSVSTEVLDSVADALADTRVCSLTFEDQSEFAVSGLEFFCDEGICFMCAER